MLSGYIFHEKNNETEDKPLAVKKVMNKIHATTSRETLIGLQAKLVHACRIHDCHSE